MDMRRMARTALAAPLLIGGGVLVLSFGTANVFAASSATHANAPANTPQTSSKKHEHDNVVCSPGTVPEDRGSCGVTFTDPTSNGEHVVGQKVCFSVDPSSAGSVAGTFSATCSKVTISGTATGTFTASGTYCGLAKITAKEPGEDGQKKHTTITILCPGTGSTTSFLVPAGSPSPPTGLLLGAGGLGVALMAGFAVWTRRLLAPRRLAASQSE